MIHDDLMGNVIIMD